MITDLSKDIIAVLTDEGQLSLPRLGTFRLRRQSAAISPIEGRAQPPSMRVEFNANLKIEDGRLARYLREIHQISAEEATAKVTAYEQELISELSKGNLVNLEGLGRLFRDHTGEIRFNPSQHNLDKAAFGLPDLPLEPVIRTERPATAPAATQTTTSTGPDYVSTIPAPRPVNTTREPDIADVVWAFLQRNIWYIAGGTAVVFLLGLWFINSRNQPSPTVTSAAETTTPPPENRVNVAPPPRTAPTPNLEEDPTPPPAEPDPPAVNIPPPNPEGYAVIAVGQFGNERNVEKMIRRISEAGYEPYTRRRGNLTRVGVQVRFQTNAELDRVLNDVRRSFEETAFVLEKNGTRLSPE